MSGEHPGKPSLGRDEQRRIYDDAHAVMGRLPLIEQTTGLLMSIYDIGADQAFELLRRQSQQHHVQVHLIANQIMTDLIELSMESAPPGRLDSDEVLLTAHQRISHIAARHTNGRSQTEG